MDKIALRYALNKASSQIGKDIADQLAGNFPNPPSNSPTNMIEMIAVSFNN